MFIYLLNILISYYLFIIYFSIIYLSSIYHHLLSIYYLFIIYFIVLPAKICSTFSVGEIEECEFMKASFASKKLHILAKAFGTNDIAPVALIVIIIIELALITLTLGFKVRFEFVRLNCLNGR